MVRATGVGDVATKQDSKSGDTNNEPSRQDGDESQIDDEYDGRSSLDAFAEWSWLEQIDSVATNGGTQIASCDAKLIRRDQIASKFWTEMAEPTSETSCLAFDLFDRYGCLNRQYYEHSFKRGSGA